MKNYRGLTLFLIGAILICFYILPAGATWCDSSYTNKRLISVDNTLGSDLTNYQVFVDLSSTPIDLNSLRIYNETSCTLRSHWCEEMSGGCCTELWIRYDKIAASSWTNNTYIYYNNSEAYSSSDGDAVFSLFDDFSGAYNDEWYHDTIQDNMEHSIIANGNAYVPSLKAASTGGLYVYNLTNGTELHHYVQSNYIAAAPIYNNSYLFIYDHVNRVIKKIFECNGTLADSVATSDIDFESMGWDTTNSRVIIPTSTAIKAYDMSDLSEAWSYSVSYAAPEQCPSPLVVGDYVYFKTNNGATFYKLFKSNGTHVANLSTGGLNPSTYGSPCYDPDHNYVYVTGALPQLHCIDAVNMTEVWNVTLGGGMTTPEIKYTPMYHNDTVFVSVRDVNSNYKAKIYALFYNNGTIKWTNTDPWDNDNDVCSSLVTENYVVLPGLSYSDYSLGLLYVIHALNGTLKTKGIMHYGASCGGISAVSGGLIIVDELGGYVECIDLGSGDATDSLHYMKNEYHNGYSGTRLTIDPSLSLNYFAIDPTKWDETNSPHIVSSILYEEVNDELYSDSAFSRPIIIRSDMKWDGKTKWSVGSAYGDGIPLAVHHLAYFLGVWGTTGQWWFIYDSGAATVHSSAVSTCIANEWYHTEMVINATAVDLYVWNTSVSRPLAANYSYVGGTLTAKKIWYGATSDQGFTQKTDNIFVRNYSSVEPDALVGDEQTCTEICGYISGDWIIITDNLCSDSTVTVDPGSKVIINGATLTLVNASVIADTIEIGPSSSFIRNPYSNFTPRDGF